MTLQLKNREISVNQTFNYSGNELKIIRGDQFNSCVFNNCSFDYQTTFSVSFFLCSFNNCSFINFTISESLFIGCSFVLCDFSCAKLDSNNLFDRHNRFIDCLNIKSFKQIKDLIVTTKAA